MRGSWRKCGNCCRAVAESSHDYDGEGGEHTTHPMKTRESEHEVGPHLVVLRYGGGRRAAARERRSEAAITAEYAQVSSRLIGMRKPSWKSFVVLLSCNGVLLRRREALKRVRRRSSFGCVHRSQTKMGK